MKVSKKKLFYGTLIVIAVVVGVALTQKQRAVAESTQLSTAEKQVQLYENLSSDELVNLAIEELSKGDAIYSGSSTMENVKINSHYTKALALMRLADYKQKE